MTRGIVEAVPTTRAIASQLPAMLQADDFCVRFTEGLDPVLAPVLSTIDNIDAYVDPWLTPVDFLDWLAGWFGLELDATWPEERRRGLVANALELGRWRGTVLGLALLVELYTGTPAEIEDGGAVAASDDPGEPLPGAAVTAVTVRYTDGPDVDARRLVRLVRDFVPAHLAVHCEPRARA
jgi:phage tail-like protein